VGDGGAGAGTTAGTGTESSELGSVLPPGTEVAEPLPPLLASPEVSSGLGARLHPVAALRKHFTPPAPFPQVHAPQAGSCQQRLQAQRSK